MILLFQVNNTLHKQKQLCRMGGDTSFQERWKKNRSWLSHVKGDPSKATCLCCNQQFSVKSAGESSVKTQGGANHQKLLKEWQSNKQISAGPPKVAEVVEFLIVRI